MLKKLLPLLFAVLISFNFISCSDSESASLPALSAQDQATTNAIYGALFDVVQDIYSNQAVKDSSATKGTYSASGDGWSASVTYTVSGGMTRYEADIDWDGFQSNNVTLNSGSIYFVYEINNTTYAANLDLEGNVSARYNGVNYSIVWDISVATSGTTTTGSGTCTLNGTAYAWTL